MLFLCRAMHFSLWATLGPRYGAIALTWRKVSSGAHRKASGRWICRDVEISRGRDRGLGLGLAVAAAPIPSVRYMSLCKALPVKGLVAS
jgi:hypothetical protein